MSTTKAAEIWFTPELEREAAESNPEYVAHGQFDDVIGMVIKDWPSSLEVGHDSDPDS